MSTITKAVDDAELRDPALEWLVRLPPETCSTVALALLEHPKGNIRRVAVSVLSDVSDARLLVPLTARLFAESPGVRAAALSLLKTKAALLGYTRGWARDLGPKGITVNTVQPGPIDTDMNPAGNGEFSDAQTAATALGRYGTADEVAAAVTFLAGPGAGYITGTTLTVDGGFNA